jgi:hypothetical protein
MSQIAVRIAAVSLAERAAIGNANRAIDNILKSISAMIVWLNIRL